ncbi:MAG TPA: proline dehydrogenase family protein [Gaiellaceae bacterium]|nr:proline dehydrogenase family protein [Gaiellaceae bacterium]
MTILDRAIVRALPAVPRPVVKRLSRRYIAGTTLTEACDVVRELNAHGKEATLDVLGEEVTLREEATGLRDAYRRALETIEEDGLRSNVSVKLTALGLKLDRGLCRTDLAAVVEEAARFGNFVRIDMEDSSTTSETLALYRELRDEGHDNVGVVLQAALKRTLTDIEALADLRPNARICKGIYVEPPDIAYQEDETIRLNFLDALEALFERGSYVGIATHDDWLIGEALTLIERRGLGREDYEFQMLLGVRPELGDELVREGHRLRIYVPFGRRWYEYSIRRLQENPKLAGYVALDTLKRLRP